MRIALFLTCLGDVPFPKVGRCATHVMLAGAGDKDLPDAARR